ncbi:MAG TPA: PLP-dependent aminotransferase family protein [Rhizomicrobium sp.]|jgi:GntR family transcriptional regulator/MocR family aminotransferase
MRERAISQDEEAGAGARIVNFVRLAEAANGQPLHERLYQRIRTLIVSGTIARGAKLAPSRVLAEALGISRNSVLNALDRLIADGWLEARRGSGVYVAYDGARISDAALRPPVRRPQAIPLEAGLPPLDLFPIETWNRLQSRRWRHMSQAGLQEGESAGWPALREAIAAHLAAARGFDCSPDQIVVTTSIPAGIDLATRALGLAGAHAWVEDPSFNGSKQSLHNCGVQLVPVPVDAEGIDIAVGERMGGDARVALVSPVAQYPTGVPMSKRRRERLLAWARAGNAWIFEDDYGWNEAGCSAARPLAADGHANVVYFNSFNHTLFPALRIAFVVLPPGLIGRFLAVREGLDGHSNVPNQMVLADFIDGGHLDDHLRRSRECLAERRAVLVQAIARHLSPKLMAVSSRGVGEVICDLLGHEEETIVARAAEAGISLTGMSRLRLIAGPPQLLLGASFPPDAMRRAVEGLAALLG